MDLLDLPLDVIQLILGPQYTRPLEGTVLSRVCKQFTTLVGENKIGAHMICYTAAAYGHLEVLKWAQAYIRPWDTSYCSAAAAGGHLGVLK